MLRVPNADTPESLTDWAEASLLTQQHADRISDADFQDVLDEAGWDKEEGLERIIQQFRHRSSAAGPRYPFVRSGAGFRRLGDWENHLCYSFLLFLSLNQSYSELRFTAKAREPAIIFEMVVARALELLTGGTAIRLGAPREAPVPRGLPAAIAHLADTINEPLRTNGGLERHGSGDDGLDVWLTKRFQDGLSSSVCIVAQCAIGTDWPMKRSELDLSLWYRHIDWFTPPMKAFAVPFQIGKDSWRETATRGGLVLDRFRIAFAVTSVELPAPIVNRMLNWARDRVAQTIRQISA